VEFAECPDTTHGGEYAAALGGGGGRAGGRVWSGERADVAESVRDRALRSLARVLEQNKGGVAAVIVEPVVQGAAGMIVHPNGYLQGAAALARQHGALLIADEVATGFGRTGRMFACEHEGVEPDILCLGKGITGGYLPLAATLTTDAVERAFQGELQEHRTLYHGHTYTGNPLAAAAALASLDLFEKRDVLREVNRKATLLSELLGPLRDGGRYPYVLDVRQKGLMVGIELAEPGKAGRAWLSSSCGGASTGDFGETTAPPPEAGPEASTRRLAHEVCVAARNDGVVIRPLGNTVVLMPPLSIGDRSLEQLAGSVVKRIGEL
jgi:adenosylmethionine-8-amino-7-oxononanoate aminotransferase